MTTAREQTRQILQQAVTWKDVDQEHAEGIADAVSDVWEPLLREALALVEGLVDQQAMPDDFYVVSLARLKEALG